MFYRSLEKKLEQYKETTWENGLIRIGKGHTRDASKYEACHCGRTSAAWYSALAIAGRLTDTVGFDTLLALEELQDKDEGSPKYGCSRWYAEETWINDTNAAFFIQLPLLTVMLSERHLIPENHKEVISRMLGRAVAWYKRELKNPIYYYTNKIVSDGAMLLGIAKITGDSEAFGIGLEFYEKWLDYTRRDGWGWGENMSLGYNNVIFAAFKTAQLSLGDTEREQRVNGGIQALIEEQKELFRYFKGYEFSPAIRNYNFEGRSRRKGLVSQIAGLGSSVNTLVNTYFWEYITFAYLFRDELKEEADVLPDKEMDIRLTKVFKDSVAYSCVMRNGSIGSLNKFPVINGSDLHKTWGLSWQSMPVNFVIYDGEVGYLRRIVRNEKETAYHPKHAFLSPCLFSDAPYPHVLTRAKQEKNIVIAKRSIEKIHNAVGELSDELYVPSFSGRCEKMTVGGREWAVLSYENATVFVSATLGLICPDGSVATEEFVRRTAVPLTVSLEKDLSVKQTAFKHEDVVTFRSERVEHGWIMIYEDKKIEDPEKYLSDVTVTERSFVDGLEPRMPSYELHSIKVDKGGKTLIDYLYDPYV